MPPDADQKSGEVIHSISNSCLQLGNYPRPRNGRGRNKRTLARALVIVAAGFLGLLGFGVAPGAETREQRTSRYLESIRNQPLLMQEFLHDMPKGGDLHNHWSGAVYAESYIEFAAHDGLCVDRLTSTLLPAPCDSERNTVPAASALEDPVLYRQLIDAFSMRNFQPVHESAHDHFFDAFLKFDPTARNHRGDMLAEVVSRAGAQHEVYLELMTGPAGSQARQLGRQVGWDSDFDSARQKLLDRGMADVVVAGRQELDKAEAKMREILHCGNPLSSAVVPPPTAGEDPGCGVVVRYLYDVLRGLPKEQVFAQMVAAFELAKADPRLVGINLVMPEDAYIPMHDFDWHMRMLDSLHRIYPQTHISLHAGELAPGLVPPEGLRFHIRDSIERGHAERIGHGVDVMYENDPLGLLRLMREHKVLVEICLTSNDMILGIRGMEHPLPVYLHTGVPVALATDDEGVARSNLTREYRRAVETYHLTYADLKRMTRNSLEHSFLPGPSLWASPLDFRPVAVCSGVTPRHEPASGGCGRFFEASERARVQWRLEVEFNDFESRF